MINSLKNDTGSEIEISGLIFSPGSVIPLSRIPEVFESQTFGRVLFYVGGDMILGLNAYGEALSANDSLRYMNTMIGSATRTTPFTQDELLQKIRDEIDMKTQGIIVGGYLYSGVLFPCPLDQQMNFKATFDMRAMLTYPFKVKGRGQNFLMLADQTDVFNWFMTGFQHVHGNLQAGWQMKDDVASLTREQLIEYADPR
jgi:hypothetical protein